MIHASQEGLRLLRLWIGVIGIIAAACTIVPADTSTDFPFQRLMTPEDLPAGWGRAGGEAPEVPGALSRSVRFAGSTNPRQEYLSIEHQLTVYPDDQLAQDSYPEWERTWFPTEKWQRPAQATFVPLDPKDQFRFACINVAINGVPLMSCRYLQQHHNLVALIIVNIDNKTMTLEQFEYALKRLDERLQDINSASLVTAQATASP